MKEIKIHEHKLFEWAKNNPRYVERRGDKKVVRIDKLTKKIRNG